MDLYFLRHGEADWPGWNKPDDERPLNKRGKAEMKKVTDFLARLKPSIEHVVTSPLPRAAQTAKAVAKKVKIDLKEDEILEPGFDVSDLRNLLRKYTGQSIMLVGHEPDFSAVIKALTGARLKMSKAGIALLDFEFAEMRGRLLWLLPPRIAKAAKRE